MLVEKHSYSENIKNQKILIFGPKLPPIGGVSVHIDRLSKVYEKNSNIVKIFDSTCEIINQNKVSYIIKIFKVIYNFRPTIIDYHTSFLKYYIHELIILVFLKLFFKFKINIIDHDPRYLYKKSYLEKKILNLLINFINKQVIIGSLTYKSYIDNKIKLKDNFSIQSAFLPPDLSEIDIKESLKKYPENLFKFIDSHKKIILINAFNIDLLEGKDLYGLDKAVNLINFLNKNNKIIENNNFAGLILLYQNFNPEYLKNIKETINKFNLADNIFFLQGNYNLWPLFSKANIFIRPTTSDGYAVSIEESLYFGTPAIASNVCQRPKGAILFDINSQSDFNNKVYNLLK